MAEMQLCEQGHPEIIFRKDFSVSGWKKNRQECPLCAANRVLFDLEEALKEAMKETGCDGDLCAHQWHEIARRALAKSEELEECFK